MLPEKFNIEKHAGYLRPIYRHLYDFTIAELAGILSRCVECRIVPRDEMDMQTAKKMVNNRVLGNSGIYEMAHRLLILKAYEIERPGQISIEIINRSGPGKKHFGQIINFLGKLDRDHTEYLLDRAIAEVSWDHDFTKLVLGRCVWDWFYQPGKGDWPAEYGQILFG